MDMYQLAAIEAQAWQDEAARNDKALAEELRAIAEEMGPAALTSHVDSWTVLSWEERLLAIADRLTARF
jgi:hypothetical protein